MSSTTVLPRPAAAPSDDVGEPVRQRPRSLTRWRPASRRTAWLWTLAVTVVAALSRFWDLGFPATKSFDEVYYATEAQEILRYGFEANPGYMYVVHPPLGKWCIALTSWIFGNDSLGWRFAPALAGTVAVVIVTRLAMRMFHSVALGVLAGVLLTVEGISLVISRVALLDIFLQTFILAGFACLVVDRDQVRGRLGDLYEAGVDLSHRIPTLGPRPWRLAGGVLLGLSCGVKWSALSFWIGFIVLSFIWDRGAIKAAGSREPWRWAFRRSLPGWFGSLVVAAVAAYLLTWLGWFVGENSWNRHWGDTHPGSGLLALFPSSIRSLIDYHANAYRFHETLYSPHAYKANPWSWLILGRPILFFYPDSSTLSGCGSSHCVQSILLIGTPLEYWAILPVALWLLWHWVTTRDWRGGAIWMAIAVGWGVWLRDQRRTGFLFYMTPLMPYLILGLTMAVGLMVTRTAAEAVTETAELARAAPSAETTVLSPTMDPHTAVSADGYTELPSLSEDDVQSQTVRSYLAARGIGLPRALRIAAVCAWLGAVLADFVWMWPIYTGVMITYDQWYQRMWFPSWI